MSSKKIISFILPIYNESENIAKLWEELTKLKKAISDRYSIEFIFIDDFSKDISLKLLIDLYYLNSDIIRVISFSKNNGHQIAVTAGMNIAKGDAVIIMDTDLQDPPMVCLDLINKWEEGYDVVYAQRRKYKTNFIKEITAFVFYRLMAKIANVDIPVDTGDFRLLSKRVNLEMGKYKEKNRFLRGLSCLVGFKHTAVQFDRQPRFAGKPSYTFGKSLKLAIDGITGFSNKPLSFIVHIGWIFAILGFLSGLLYIFYAVITKTNISGWASLMFVTITTSGVQILMLGIIGEYIGRIYTEVLDRPLYTVDIDTDNNKI